MNKSVSTPVLIAIVIAVVVFIGVIGFMSFKAKAVPDSDAGAAELAPERATPETPQTDPNSVRTGSLLKSHPPIV